MTALRPDPVAVRPGDLREARDAVRDAPGPLRFRGGGTKQGWGAAPAPPATVVDTTGLADLTDHSAGDMVAVVGAGMSLAALQEALAPAGQWLAVDPPHVAAGATCGGVFATNDAGPRRHRFGSLRDLVIGVTFVTGDGELARAGGRVVKNVAGFDLMRLLCGSLGTLGLVTELIVRLHPLPETSRTVRVAATPAQVQDVALALADATVEPTAVDAADGALWVRLEGRPAGVAAQVDAVRALAEARGAGPCESLDGEDEAAAWRSLTAAHAGGDGETVARAAAAPSAHAAVAAALETAAADAGAEARLASHAGLGLHSARLSGGDAAAHAAAVAGWRRRLAGLGGHVTVRERAPGVDDHVAVWPEVDGAALELMRRVKTQLDPTARCAPGSYVGGL